MFSSGGLARSGSNFAADDEVQRMPSSLTRSHLPKSAISGFVGKSCVCSLCASPPRLSRCVKSATDWIQRGRVARTANFASTSLSRRGRVSFDGMKPRHFRTRLEVRLALCVSLSVAISWPPCQDREQRIKRYSRRPVMDLLPSFVCSFVRSFGRSVRRRRRRRRRQQRVTISKPRKA